MKKILKSLSEDGTSYTLNCTNRKACVMKYRQSTVIGIISVCENKSKS